MVLQCFNRPQKKQKSPPQKCAFACNCWFAFPYFTSFVVSLEHTPMWSSFLCLSMIRQYVTAVMILTVRGASHLRFLSQLRQMLPCSPCWETDEACDSSGLCACVCLCVCVLYNAWDYSDLVAEAWILVYPALEGVLAKLCVWLCVSLGERVWT